MAGLSVRDLEIEFGALRALGPLSLDVAAGECVVLLGPSGCGKSTLLAAVAGLTGPTRGAITAGPRAPGMVFQEHTLLPWLNAGANVSLPLELAGVAADEARRRALAALETCGLGDFVAARPAALSGGMRMRAALARALVGEPEALLLDEPFAAIDELGRRTLDDLVLRLKAEKALSVLFVTHSVEEAAYLADRIIVLSPRPGQIVAEIPVRWSLETRGTAYLTSDVFAHTCVQARKALAAVIGEHAA